MITAIFGVLLVIVMVGLACLSVYLCVTTPEKQKRTSYGLFAFAFVMFIFHALFQAPGAMALGAFGAVAAAAMRRNPGEPPVQQQPETDQSNSG